MTLKDFFDRYGPTVAVVAVLTMLVVLMPGNAGNREGIDLGAGNGANTLGDFSDTRRDGGGPGGGGGEDLGGGSDFAAGGGGASGAGGGGGGGGGNARATTAGGAAPAPSGIKFGQGPNCRSDKRQIGISRFMPPCVDWKPGTANGDESKIRGVEDDKIIVTRFRSQVDPATRAALVGIGADDTEEDLKRMVEAIRRYYNHHYETYGREVVIVDVQASGRDDNDEAMRSDAVKIANEIGAFANVGGPTVLASELVNRGVLCMCLTSMGRGFYLDHPPYIFSTLPTSEGYFEHVTEYMAKRLWNQPAKHAGDATMRTQSRKFGLIWYEGNKKADPYRQKAHAHFLNLLKKSGMSLAADIGYVFDLQRAGDQAASMISKLKSEGVNHVIFMGDPLYPIFITSEATRQAYFPEWMITGTALVDTTFFGRTYDQQQWAHAFGISPLYVFWSDVSGSPGYREYHHGMPGGKPGDEGVSINVLRASYELLFIGIQMAGPNLSANSFAQGMFAYPPTGGTPAHALYGFTRQDPTAYKDFTEVWWDPNGTGKDETSKEGRGILMKSNRGQRYTQGRWPKAPAQVFGDDPNPVYTDDNPPGGRDNAHEQDGHTHPYDKKKCLSC